MLDFRIGGNLMIYDKLYDDDGQLFSNRKVAFLTIENDGSIKTVTTGQPLTVNRTGFVYIVDEIVIENIDKFEVIKGNLKLRDGEALEEPFKSEKELQREALLKQLAELDSQPAE